MNYGKLTAGTTKTAIDTAKPSEKGEIITYLSRMGDVLDDISERGKIVHLVVAVHAVVDGDKADVHLREPDFRVQPHLQIVPAKPGHILYDYGADLSCLYIGKHLLKAGPVERYPTVPVVS